MAKSTTTTTTSAEAKKYAKLLGKVDYDHEAAEQLAEALNEIADLERRATQLKQIVEENKELHQFVWRTAEDIVIALHELEDDHLQNIMLHLLRNQRAIPRAIRGEAISRGLVIPATVPIDWSESTKRLRASDRGDIL
jgi:hypothetical protein